MKVTVVGRVEDLEGRTVAQAMVDFCRKYTARLIIAPGHSTGSRPGELLCIDIETADHLIGGPRLDATCTDAQLALDIDVVLPAIMDALGDFTSSQHTWQPHTREHRETDQTDSG